MKLLFHEDGGNLEVNLDKVSHGWKLAETCATTQVDISLRLIFHQNTLLKSMLRTIYCEINRGIV